MAFAVLQSRALVGMSSPEVIAEVHASNGLPSFNIVGLPETSVKESKERVRSALLNAGFQLPPKRLTVNLAPADLPKTGGRYDLVIALTVLMATEQLQNSDTMPVFCFGELALNGEVRAVQGLLPSLLAMKDIAARVLVPKANENELALFIQSYPQTPLQIHAVESLLQATQALTQLLYHYQADESDDDFYKEPISTAVDLSDIYGQLQAKRALEIAASGHHSMLMIGPPGAGKSLLASALISILPPLEQQEALELASIQSLTGKEICAENFYQRPFIQPHHSASAAALVGGGTIPKPGALSLAHKGVLFLDELPEFNRQVLEALREPLERKQVHISRVNQHVSFPADNLLISAMNPSPSGFFADDALGRCKDTPDQIARYQKKVSGPLMDRIDLHLQIPAVDIKSLHQNPALAASQESSSIVRERVTNVRQAQLQRQGCYNAELDIRALQEFASIDQACQNLLEKAGHELGLSARGYHRVIRVARTLADMQNQPKIDIAHIAEALGFRSQMSY